MSKKIRVHELAKEYGLTSQELANKLRDLGITEVKGPQSTLDEFQLLHVEGLLAAHNINRQPTADTTTSLAGGLTIKRKKKKLSDIDEAREAAFAEPAEEAPAPPVAPTPPAAPASIAPPSTPPGAPPTAPIAAPRAEPEPTPIVEIAPHVPAKSEPAPAPTPVVEPEIPTEIAAQAQPAPSSNVETPVVSEAPPVASGGLPPVGEVPAKPVRKPLGKVVGFVDLSKMSAPPNKDRAESRRLRSKDDVAPDVNPTLGHDRKKALVRGDHASRGSLTASQLREKESGRYLRRKGQQQSSPPMRSSRPMRGMDASTSPVAGGEVRIGTPITIKKLADALSLKVNQVLGRAMTSLGQGFNLNSTLDNDTAELLAGDFDVKLIISDEKGAEDSLLTELVRKRTAVEEAELVIRPPSVAFLGHVDHGKTTMLDKIRDSRIAEGEAGGITQHIGAYQVKTKAGHLLTVIDTPGHEAFTAMRARGARAVDIVVLVVAADDGVMPSTIEALNHARAAKVPIVVAVNKCDKPQAQPDRVRQQLAAQGLSPEEWGGSTAMLNVSALTGAGLDEMLERVFLESEVLELKSHAKGPASGIVLEAEVQEGKGRVAYLLVKDGTLNQGDVILAGEGYGKVRSIHDDRSRAIKFAGPSVPVEVSGLSELPSVGDQFHVVENLELARDVAEERQKKNRAMSLVERRSVTAENLLQAVAASKKKTINVVLRCDVQGSLEALKTQIETLTHEEVDVRILQAGLGSVTEADVNLAAPAEGVVLAFRVGVNDKARVAAERGNVIIRHYEVIYELLDELRQMMEGTLAPEMTEQITGHVEVRAIFKSSKIGKIAGCHVIDGTIARDCKVRVMRDRKLVHSGTLASLKREKDDTREVREGFDCGIVIKDFENYEVGDVIEAFKIVAVKRLLKI